MSSLIGCDVIVTCAVKADAVFVIQRVFDKRADSCGYDSYIVCTSVNLQVHHPAVHRHHRHAALDLPGRRGAV